jgi:hypothetical protein
MYHSIMIPTYLTGNDPGFELFAHIVQLTCKFRTLSSKLKKTSEIILPFSNSVS